MSKGKTKCSCNGENENCCKCNGWGYYEPATIEDNERNAIPKLRPHFTSRFSINSNEPLKEHVVEAKIEEWKRKRKQDIEIIDIEFSESSSKYYKYSLDVAIVYKIISTARKNYRRAGTPSIYSYPEHYNSNEKSLDASKGVGYVARDQGQYGSFPMHDDYSDDPNDG